MPAVLRACLLLTAVTFSAAAQPSPYQLARQAFSDRDGRLDYLAPLRVLEAHQAEFAQASSDAYAQTLATYHSFVGQVAAPALRTMGPTDRLVPASDVLPALARATSVVILNEDHTQPAHRASCRQLLTQLAPLGYRYLAVEALDPDQGSPPPTRKFPLASSGFFTREPAMGNLLRAAAEANFTVFGYELRASQEKELADWRQRSNYRDSLQALNILVVLRAQPKAKMLIYVGHDHLLEKKCEGLKRLATYLHELGQLDPLTIDQTQAYPAGSATQPQVLLDASGQPTVRGRYAGAVDVQLVLPQWPPVQGRPGWLATTRPQQVVIPAAYAGQPVLAQLFDQAEYAQYAEQAIPLDQYLVPAGQAQAVLFPFDSRRKTVVKFRPAP